MHSTPLDPIPFGAGERDPLWWTPEQRAAMAEYERLAGEDEPYV